MQFRSESMEVLMDEEGVKTIIITAKFLERPIIFECTPHSFTSFSLAEKDKKFCANIDTDLSKRLGTDASIVVDMFPMRLSKDNDVYTVLDEEELRKAVDQKDRDREILNEYIEENNGMLLASVDASMGMHITCSYSPFTTALMLNRIIQNNKEVAKHLSTICLLELEKKVTQILAPKDLHTEANLGEEFKKILQ